jgi:class 3 adenylate cyclase
MDLFKNRLDQIGSIIKGERSGRVSLSAQLEDFKKAKSEINESKDDKVVAKVNYSEIEKLFGTHKFSFLEPTIGPHPDFKHMKHNDCLNHYAVSVFIDIKGSTYLSNKYDLLQIRQIKDTILTLAIEVCSFFGGHIHRLQGDGIFVYFVRSEMHDLDAIINALNASSLISYFMKYRLPQYFTDESIKAPQIRIGIDYGNKEKTLWSYYGLEYCNELTTTGLHTDLAAKLQSKALGNGIMIGQNIVDELDLQETLVSLAPNDKFIFNNQYKKYEFKWENYILTYDFIKRDGNGGMEMQKPRYYLQCEIAKENSEQFFAYHQNLYSIPKMYKIRFTLYENGNPYVLKTYQGEQIEWKIVNTGKQARQSNALTQEMKEQKDKTICIVNSEYLGHHDMQCKIIRKGISVSNVNARYPVFVR